FFYFPFLLSSFFSFFCFNFLFFLIILFIDILANLPCIPPPKRPSIPEKLPFDIFFIISCICLNCFIMRLTSWIGLPDPAAIRRRRLGFNQSGFSLSCGVIEYTIALVCSMFLGSTFKFFSAVLLALPGIIFIISSIGPIF